MHNLRVRCFSSEACGPCSGPHFRSTSEVLCFGSAMAAAVRKDSQPINSKEVPILWLRQLIFKRTRRELYVRRLLIILMMLQMPHVDQISAHKEKINGQRQFSCMKKRINENFTAVSVSVSRMNSSEKSKKTLGHTTALVRIHFKR